MNYTGPVDDCCNKIEKPRGELKNRIEYFYGNLSNLNDIARELEDVLERLTGPEPAGGNCGKETARSEGIFSDLAELTERYSAIEHRLGNVMERLQQAI